MVVATFAAVGDALSDEPSEPHETPGMTAEVIGYRQLAELAVAIARDIALEARTEELVTLVPA